MEIDKLCDIPENISTSSSRNNDASSLMEEEEEVVEGVVVRWWALLMVPIGMSYLLISSEIRRWKELVTDQRTDPLIEMRGRI